jgi:predicted deacylase
VHWATRTPACEPDRDAGDGVAFTQSASWAAKSTLAAFSSSRQFLADGHVLGRQRHKSIKNGFAAMISIRK